MRRLLALLAVAAPLLAPAVAPRAADAPLGLAATGDFHAVAPYRVATRTVRAGTPTTVEIAGYGGVAAEHVAAVAMSVTVGAPTASGHLTVHPAGAPRPTASNVNFVAGRTATNLVTVPLGGGAVTLHLSAGSAQVTLDVAGWYADRDGEPGDRQHPLPPARVYDSRRTGGALAPYATRTVTVAGRGGVPASGARAVVVNVTVTGPRATGSLVAHEAGTGAPGTASASFAAGATVATLAVVPLDESGRLAVTNRSAGTTHVVLDVAGWFGDGPGDVAGQLRPLPPVRVLDTRTGLGARPGKVPGPLDVTLDLGNRGGLPGSGVRAVLLNLTAVQPDGPGYLTVHPDGTPRPLTSVLNYPGRTTVANLVQAAVSPSGRVRVAVSGGATHLVADVAGWYTAGSVLLPRAGADELPGLSLNQVVVDTASRYAYVSDGPAGTVRVVDLALHREVATVPVGGMPFGLDLTPDGRELWVAPRGSDTLAVVDTRLRTVVRRVPAPTARGYAYDVKVGSCGEALVTTAPVNLPLVYGLYRVPLAGGPVTTVRESPHPPFDDARVRVFRTGDRSAFLLDGRDYGGGQVLRLPCGSSVPTGSDFAVTGHLAADATGSVVLVDGTLVLDATLADVGEVSGGPVPTASAAGAAVAPDGRTAFRLAEDPAGRSRLEVVDLAREVPVSAVPLPGQPVWGNGLSGVHGLALAPDGRTLVLVGPLGIRVVRW